MANRDAGIEPVNDKAGGRSGGVIGTFVMPVVAIGTLLGKAWNAVMADGVIEAAGRQGIDELGAALKAFPESGWAASSSVTCGSMRARRIRMRRRTRNRSMSPP